MNFLLFDKFAWFQYLLVSFTLFCFNVVFVLLSSFYTQKLPVWAQLSILNTIASDL